MNELIIAVSAAIFGFVVTTICFYLCNKRKEYNRVRGSAVYCQELNAYLIEDGELVPGKPIMFLVSASESEHILKNYINYKDLGGAKAIMLSDFLSYIYEQDEIITPIKPKKKRNKQVKAKEETKERKEEQ